MLKLTNSEKCELLHINLEELNNEIRKNILVEQLYTISDQELGVIQSIICDSIDLEVETKAPEDDVRISFYTLNNRVVIIKKKKMDIKLLFDLLIHSTEFLDGGIPTRIGIVLNVIVKLFLNVLDGEIVIVYSYLCVEYFVNGIKFNNTEIFNEINKYLKTNFGFGWSNDKINKVLLELEDLGVIEFSDGVLHVKDKIYL